MKEIIVKDKFDNKYNLCFTAETVSLMERRGFDVNEIESKPMTMIKTLFAGAFLANHKNTKSETIDEIYASLKDKTGLLTKLVEMYNEPLDMLVDEGNAEWSANW